MKILFLAPQPFYQDRGTPIATHLFLRALDEQGHEVDLLTYHEGQPKEYRHVRIHRTPRLGFVQNIRPSLSWKKLICDALMFGQAFGMMARGRYDAVHAVEESVFMALTYKLIFRVPYVYDMDSSLAEQVVEKFRWLAPLSGIFRFFEGLAARNAAAVVTICGSLADLSKRYGARHVLVLNDVSLLSTGQQSRNGSLRKSYPVEGPLFLYVGNLETYQGIDLLLESFATVRGRGFKASLAVIGGADDDIARYREKVKTMGLSECVFFAGRRLPDFLGSYLSEADVLVSPRTEGGNTPMKIYSYLHSGKPVLATDLPTHREVLDDTVALLARPEKFAEGMIALIQNEGLRRELGGRGKQLVEKKYTYSKFREQVQRFYEALEGHIA